MPRVMAAPFDHITGFHCATSSLRALLRHFGYEISETLCLGLGLAPDFFYFHGVGFEPSHYFLGRNRMLEQDFFHNMNIPAETIRHEAPAESWPPVKAILDEGHPVLIQVNIAYLPYFNTSTNFPGHKVILAGYDEQAEDAFISDSEYPEMQVVTLEQLQRARWHPNPPWELKGQWWKLRSLPSMRPLKEAVPLALTENARRVVQTDDDMFGVMAMRCMAKSLPSWNEAEDWKWCARFGYQVIEKRGTGGGSFRAKYAAFLSEAAEYDERIPRLRLAERMTHIAAQWTAFAQVLKHISEQEEPHGFDEAAHLFTQIADLEQGFFEDVLKG